MSEELNKDQEVKNEGYKYVPEKDEQLIVDKPSEPLKVKKQSKKGVDKIDSDEIEKSVEDSKLESELSKMSEKITVERTLSPILKKDFIKKEIKTEKIVKSNKELYESYIKDLKNFSLILNGEVIYDSSLDKFKEYPVKFENDYFVLYGRKYSYNGLKIQKINIR